MNDLSKKFQHLARGWKLAAFSCLLLLCGCRSGAGSQARRVELLFAGSPVESIGFVPLRVLAPTTGAVDCPWCGQSLVQDEIPRKVLLSASTLLTDHLRELGVPKLLEISARAVETEQAAALPCEKVLLGYLLQYRERQGTSTKIYAPAAVALHLHVLDKGPHLLGTATFKQAQRALSESQVLPETFFLPNNRWLTVAELMHYAIVQMLEELFGQRIVARETSRQANIRTPDPGEFL